MFTSLSKARYYGDFPDNKVSAVAVKVAAGQSPDLVVDRINQLFPNVRAWKREDIQASTINFLVISSNIGTSVGSLIVFALISGFFIIGLTLYSAALDRLKDYGTLKAIGATDQYVRNLLFTQSLLVAIVGFVIGYVMLLGFKNGVAEAGLIIQYPPAAVFALFMVTIFISLGGSFFALSKLNGVEPASVFR